jgi:hypothetical protein
VPQPAAKRRSNAAPSLYDWLISACAALPARLSRIMTPAFAPAAVPPTPVTRATISTSPPTRWLTKWKPSPKPAMSLPAALTVNVPLSCVAPPATPASPTS